MRNFKRSHILHLALAIRNRGYTNEVRLRGLRSNQGFQPAQAGFASCSQASALDGFPGLFALLLPLGEATGAPVARLLVAWYKI
ncbi:hypothetical protein [Nostoc sp.]|uniref:hypothetical protein n=1 Tax=Nostoc sp. TaxID=1180 RepID=UPI002FF6DB67